MVLVLAMQRVKGIPALSKSRCQEMYRKIVQIPFFEKYQRWKLYSVWKSAMRSQKAQDGSPCAAEIYRVTGNFYRQEASIT